MKPTNLFLSVFVAVALMVVLTVGGLLWFNLRRMMPVHDGLAYVTGLHDTVEVIRDEWGIPHIYASHPDDLFFAQGYVQAQDRWWQMEFQRHTGLGRIGELTGYNLSAVESDLFIRTWGWNRAAVADTDFVSEETRQVLEAYAAGVNTYIAGKPGGALALEYSLLGLNGVNIVVEPWEPLHSLAWAKVMAWNLGGNAATERLRLRLYEEIGPEMADLYLPPYPFDRRPTILTADDLPVTAESLSAAAPVAPPGVDYAALDVTTALAGGPLAEALLPQQGQDIGSNNWVIAGSNTASGRPILANDPHLGIQMPSIWYEIGLHCRPVSADCPYDLVGFSFVGVPGIIIGHNPRIAWGVTNVGPDVQDLYIIRVNPDDPFQYDYDGEWRDMEVVTEVIRFGNGYRERADDPATEPCEGVSGLPINADGDLEIQVRLTHFGPIITDNTITDDCRFVAFDETSDPLALRWTALEPGDLFRAFLEINRAANWEDFRAALAYFDWPSQNFVYADVDGNIGYQMPGKIPIRAADHSGLVPVPGWTADYEWRGYIPYDRLPRALNPERGWIVTANHAVVPPIYYDQLAQELGDAYGEDANTVISQEWEYGYRGQRIVDMVSATAAHTAETVAEIQGDNHNLKAEELLPYLLNLEPEDADLAEAVQWLAEWNLQNTMDDPQSDPPAAPRAALFEAFWVALVDNLWNDQLGFASDGGSNVMWGTRLLLDRPDHQWWDDIRTEDVVETRDDILIRSLRDALDYMSENWGADRESWRWGDLHTATFVSNPLGQSGIGLIESLFNAGPVPTGGGSGIVNATGWSASQPFAVRSLPSLRVIIDMADLENSCAIHTTGQSGHPFSPHYADLINDWRFIRYHPLRFGEEAVREAAAHRLELRPAPAIGQAGE